MLFKKILSFLRFPCKNCREWIILGFCENEDCKFFRKAAAGKERINNMSEINKKEFAEVNEVMCEEVHNCTGTREHEGKTYFRGCGNVQPARAESDI